MKRLILTTLAVVLLYGPAAAKTELLSIKLPSVKGRYVIGFKIETWGVDILAVCHIPIGWRINAGGYEDSQGLLAGETKEGEPESTAKDFDGMFLVDVHRYQAKAEGSHGEHPASFAGSVDLWPYESKINKAFFKASDFSRTHAQACPGHGAEAGEAK